MKVVHTYDEYLIACKEVDETSVYAWMPKVDYIITDIDELRFLKKRVVGEKTLSKIIQQTIDNIGKEFYYGTLIGLELTNEDYYYIYERFGKRVYDTCVNGLK